MLNLLDEKQLKAFQLIQEAQRVYLDSDCEPETSAQAYCGRALKSLELQEDNFVKWILVCEANIWLCASILKDLRLMHVETDPLNSSADLFDPSLPRDRFMPRAVERLCLQSYRHGIRRLRQTHEGTISLWREKIVVPYASLKRTQSQEKRAFINISTKLAAMSLLISTPLESLEVFAYLYHWTKCAAALRWLSTLLVATGFPNTAAQLVSLAPASAASPTSMGGGDKYGTMPLLQQVTRLGKIVKENVDDPLFADKVMDTEKGSVATAFRYRIHSLTSFVDSFARLLPNISPTTPKRPAVVSISQARKYAGQIFFSANKMDGCEIMPGFDDTQKFLDTFWYLQMLFNDGLMQQRVGNVEWAAALLKEGHSIAFVLCCPYWILKFSTSMVQLHSICAVYDSDVLDQLAFIKSVFCEGDNEEQSNGSTPKNTGGSSAFESTAVGTKNGSVSAEKLAADLSRLRISSWPLQSQIELSRRVADERKINSKLSGYQRSPLMLENGNQPKTPASLDNSSRCVCHENWMDLHVQIFGTCCTTLSLDGTLLGRERYAVLLSKICGRRKSRCPKQFGFDAMALDDLEYVVLLNEPLYNLLDFYLLSLPTGGVTNLKSDDMRILAKAITSLPSTNTALFCLYYRLSFSYLFTAWKLARTRYSSKLRSASLDDDSSQKDNHSESAKLAAWNGRLKESVVKMIDDVQLYGYTHFFPWYASVRRLIGSLYLHDAPAILPTKPTSRASLIAANFNESAAVSFRHAVIAKDGANDSEMAARLCQFNDECSLTDALAQLPKDWTVVSLHLLETTVPPRLVLCRLSGRCKPVVVDLGDVIERFDAVKEFNKFVQDNETSIKETERKIFWTGRYALEKKLDEHLKQLEAEWFGHFRVLLRGFSQENADADEIDKQRPRLDSYSAEVLLAANGILEDEEKRNYLADLLSVRGGKFDKLINYANSTDSQSSSMAPVFLILDRQLHGIPFENMPILRGQPVCRAACLQFLLRMITVTPLPKMVRNDRVYYVVNPSRDLTVTEDFFKWFSDVKTWRGTFGTQPDLATMQEAVASNEIYVYCGHNSGVHCLQSYRKVEQLTCNATVLLMGCNSCKMVDRGAVFEPYNVALSYMIAKSPCVVGCLWSVTSPDIDRYLAEVLKLWLNVTPIAKSNSRISPTEIASLLRAVARAKSACKLPLLTGAAVVAFGLPVFCDQSFTSDQEGT